MDDPVLKGLMWFCVLMIGFCFFGMFKSCESSQNFIRECESRGGVVKWGGRGGSDLCLKPGVLVDLPK